MKNTWKRRGTTLILMASMVAILTVAILFNFNPEKVGYFRTATDANSFTPVLAPEFSVHLPWLNLWSVLFAAVGQYRLQQRFA